METFQIVGMRVRVVTGSGTGIVILYAAGVVAVKVCVSSIQTSTVIFWIMIQCSMVGGYKRFAENCCLHLHSRRLLQSELNNGKITTRDLLSRLVEG
jgi:hypothetical protein